MFIHYLFILYIYSKWDTQVDFSVLNSLFFTSSNWLLVPSRFELHVGIFNFSFANLFHRYNILDENLLLVKMRPSKYHELMIGHFTNAVSVAVFKLHDQHHPESDTARFLSQIRCFGSSTISLESNLSACPDAQWGLLYQGYQGPGLTLEVANSQRYPSLHRTMCNQIERSEGKIQMCIGLEIGPIIPRISVFAKRLNENAHQWDIIYNRKYLDIKSPETMEIPITSFATSQVCAQKYPLLDTNIKISIPFSKITEDIELVRHYHQHRSDEGQPKNAIINTSLYKSVIPPTLEKRPNLYVLYLMKFSNGDANVYKGNLPQEHPGFPKRPKEPFLNSRPTQEASNGLHPSLLHLSYDFSKRKPYCENHRPPCSIKAIS